MGEGLLLAALGVCRSRGSQGHVCRLCRPHFGVQGLGLEGFKVYGLGSVPLACASCPYGYSTIALCEIVGVSSSN